MPKLFKVVVTFEDQPDGTIDIHVSFDPVAMPGDHSPAIDMAIGIVDAIANADEDSDDAELVDMDLENDPHNLTALNR